MSDINPESMVIIKGVAEQAIKDLKVEDKFQGVRMGYFCVDTSSNPDNIVLNRTVTLKEDSKKDK